MASLVTEIPAAVAAAACRHFEAAMSFETDCWDVHESLKLPKPDFVLLDVRGHDAFAAGHVPGAVNLPHRAIIDDRMAAYAKETVFVVYCAGPHCNGANRAALRLARLGRPVKIMIGGMTGWRDEGFAVTKEPASGP